MLAIQRWNRTISIFVAVATLARDPTIGLRTMGSGMATCENRSWRTWVLRNINGIHQINYDSKQPIWLTDTRRCTGGISQNSSREAKLVWLPLQIGYIPQIRLNVTSQTKWIVPSVCSVDLLVAGGYPRFAMQYPRSNRGVELRLVYLHCLQV